MCTRNTTSWIASPIIRRHNIIFLFQSYLKKKKKKNNNNNNNNKKINKKISFLFL